MPITVNYNPDIELLGEVAYDTGAGAAQIREQQRRDALRAAAQQRIDQLRAADIDRYDRYNMTEIQRLQRAEELAQRERENAAARQQQQQQFEAEQGRLGQAQEQSYRLDSQRLYGEQLGRQDEAQLRQSTRDYYLETIEQKRKQDEAQQEQWRQEQAIKYGGEWKLDEATQQQKDAEMAQLQKFRVNTEAWEYDKYIQQLEQKYRGLEKLVPKEKTPEQEVQQNTYYDPALKVLYTRQADNTWRANPLKEEKDTSDKDRFEKERVIFETLAKMQMAGGEGPTEFKARRDEQEARMRQAFGLTEPIQPQQQPSTDSSYGFALQEQPPIDTDAVLQQLPPESQAQIAELVAQIKEADASGDAASAQTLREELRNMLAQLGLQQ